MKVLFMGTPQFAVPSLKALHASKHTVVGVVTVPDKPVGRGLKLRPSAVKECAEDLKIPILQPGDLQAPGLPEQLEAFQADIFFVVAFRILPPRLFLIPPKGTINLHASLLPKYRGAAPINWAIINGERETGLTTFFIQEKVDTGDIILQRAIPIGKDETAGELHDRLATLGAALVVETVDLVEAGQAKGHFQQGEISKAPKLTKELTRIDWVMPAEQVRNLIRGLSPVPGATTQFRGRRLKIYRASRPDTTAGGDAQTPGTVIAVQPKAGYIDVTTGDGVLRILELQMEGKKRMTTAEFLRGHQVKSGECFE